jgi:hypothetical protein
MGSIALIYFSSVKYSSGFFPAAFGAKTGWAVALARRTNPAMGRIEFFLTGILKHTMR